MYNLLLSGGGIDSNSLLSLLKSEKEKFEVLHINYGQINCRQEQDSVDYFCTKYDVFNTFYPIRLGANHWAPNCSLFKITPAGSDVKTIRRLTLESRNLMLISIAVSIVASKGGGTVYVAFHLEPDALMADTTPNFINNMNTIAHSSTYFPVTIRAPFFELGLDKNGIMDYAWENDKEIFTKSHYCHNKVKCGVCDKCKQVDFFLGWKDAYNFRIGEFKDGDV